MIQFNDPGRIYLRLTATPDDRVTTEDFANLVRDVSLLTDAVTLALTEGFDSPQFNQAISFRHGPRPPRSRRLRLEFVSQRSPLDLVASLPADHESAAFIVHSLVSLGLPIGDAFLRRIGERVADLLPFPRPPRRRRNRRRDEEEAELPAVPDYKVVQEPVDMPRVLRELRESGGGRVIERIRHRVVTAPHYREVETEVEREIEISSAEKEGFSDTDEPA